MRDEGKESRAPPDALLILGPTGSGKSPLGDRLEETGLRGRDCHHFDFGACLRREADRAPGSSLLTPEEVEHVRSLLERGALLEDDRFPVAERILRGFLAERALGSRDLVVLNGLPRHVGQAQALEPTVRVIEAVCLEADVETVYRRIETNAGGDRVERADDGRLQVRRKLEIYQARTRPLLEWYCPRGVKRLVVPIGQDTSAAEVVAFLSRHCDL